MNEIPFEDLTIGRSETLTRVVSGEVIEAFAEVSGDDNPLHLDADYAAGTPFGGRIAHGMLSAAFISAAIGTRLPGRGCAYLSQVLRFRRPVRVGDTVTVTVTVRALDAVRARATLETVCRVGDTVVVDGEALVLVARRA